MAAGEAKEIIESEGSHVMTAQRGTPQWMAPEAFLSNQYTGMSALDRSEVVLF